MVKRFAWRALLLAAAFVAMLAWARSRDAGHRPAAVGASADTTALERRGVTLWFASADAESLVHEDREIPYPADVRGRIPALVTALASGPDDGGIALVPAATRVEHAWLDERGGLTLDLSSAFRDEFRGGALAEELAIGSLMKTLTDNLPEVHSVRFLCAGAPMASLAGHVPLDRALDPEDWR